MLSFDFLILIAGLGLAATAVYLFSTAVFTNNADKEAMAWASGDEPIQSKSKIINMSRPLIHQFTLQHAQRVKTAARAKRIERAILTAGLSGELNVDEYIGMQILWGLMAPVALVVLKFALGLDLPIVLMLGISGFGFLYPSIYCASRKGRRYVEVVVDMPFFIDLMALSTEAGLDFMGALQRIVDKAENSTLADEFRIVLKDIKLGSSRKEALMRLADRLDIPEITSFSSVVRDADETGASLAQVLKDQAIQMRLERIVRAEKAGARASQLMLMPMMFLILPAVFIMVFAPVVLQFMYGGK